MRFVLRTLALLALFPYAGVVLLLLTGTASWSSIAYVAATGLLLGGLVTLPDPAKATDTVKEGRARRRPRGLSRGALAALGAVALARAVVTRDGARGDSALGIEARSSRMVTVGAGQGPQPESGSRFLNRLVDEGDVATAGTRVLFATGALRDDRAEVPLAMTTTYAAMRRAQGDVPSPVLATYLGLEHPEAFDLVLIEPPHAAEAGPPRSAIVFLHGLAGGFDLPCWQIARAVESTGTVTACPSTGWAGDWWSSDGEATLRRTVEVLRARGVERIVLAGLSNGGYGASTLAPRMKGVFAGLVLISGASPGAPAAGVPTLVIHGRRDTMARYDDSRRYAASTGATLLTLEAGHFAMLVRGEETDRALRDFVAARVEARAER